MTALPIQRPATPREWPNWVFDTLLWILFLGPVIAPLFQASSLPILNETGWLARDLLSRYVCPTPERSLLLFGMPMAVCARCWGATIGLWAARGLIGLQTGAGLLSGFRRLDWSVSPDSLRFAVLALASRNYRPLQWLVVCSDVALAAERHAGRLCRRPVLRLDLARPVACIESGPHSIISGYGKLFCGCRCT
jgi:hypothetical protein